MKQSYASAGKAPRRRVHSPSGIAAILNPPYKSSDEANRGQIISRQPVVASCDAPEILQPVEVAFDAPAQFVDTLIEAELLFPVAAIWNDGLGSALVQVFAQLGAIVGLVAEHAFRRLHSANEELCDRAIVCFTSGQQDGDKALCVPKTSSVLIARPNRLNVSGDDRALLAPWAPA
jgi:hypothetical protein